MVWDHTKALQMLVRLGYVQIQIGSGDTAAAVFLPRACEWRENVFINALSHMSQMLSQIQPGGCNSMKNVPQLSPSPLLNICVLCNCWHPGIRLWSFHLSLRFCWWFPCICLGGSRFPSYIFCLAQVVLENQGKPMFGWVLAIMQVWHYSFLLSFQT